MTSILGRIFPDRGGAPAPSRGDAAFAAAMNESDDLMRQMREAPSSTDAVRSLVAGIWRHAHNAPFVATVYEAVQEMKSGLSDN